MFGLEVFHSFYYIIIAVCTLCTLPTILTTKGVEQNNFKNHIACEENTVVRTGNSFLYQNQIQKTVEEKKEKKTLFHSKEKNEFHSYLPEYKQKLFDFELFSRPPPVLS
jgi:hypothetical protein